MRMPVGTAREQSVMEGHVIFLLQCECFAVGAMSLKPCARRWANVVARTSCSTNDEPIKDPKPFPSSQTITHRSTLHIRLVKIYSNCNTAQEL
ncbi:type I inositol-1,4,5-trisphosphate 5-phosphatase [Musa troglodytarum]|uniref:Type I inositol-1,4,5-trisphosphate 5-phosphatase n=1 Tax=Musa troglodytarum TaxID=320322 RepID=A0A9E7F8E1_9LILI|nr:type I inositol-1,4,5-trisphosphate 5-phosphatase [Musa troglodytarum]